ncbi:class I SAM-dependent methyltransferase [Bartonella sp. W8097]|uniref:SAM-dependent methyltransferase n=1 Tax=Bartonella apihabitans TaxID=2750929 RepID=UPI0018DD478B|nr:cyclopropane-fatty-acyl-phospholipid synthase family protein [Bartonella apihabitans]MBI0019570.1 class I SAM-dependent methyltransferase [Bartonella apihabitans]
MFALLKTAASHIITKGNLTIIDSRGVTYQFGDQTGKPIQIRFTSAKWEREVALDPALKLGEAYMNDGFEFIKGDIYSLLETIFESTGPIAENQLWMKAFSFIRTATKRFVQMNTLRRSAKNVEHHYDLSGKLYEMFLDPDRQYSCGYFENPNVSLGEAQLAKKRHLAAKLQVKENEKLLDIGCGWGGLGLYFARVVGANVTGVTLSHEQHGIANQRAKDMGLQDKAKFFLLDYRKLDDAFDKIVSVGMFEHVGIGHYKEYFDHVKRLLKPDGRFVLHSIGRSGEPGATNPWIAKYIFPGGYIPALSEVIPVIEKSGLIITDIEILRLHYAETLKAWREAFLAHWDEAKALYDERFCRMWEFYLAASESAFRWQGMMVFQIQLAHKQDAVPLTRDYIGEEEARLKKIDTDPNLEKSEGNVKSATKTVEKKGDGATPQAPKSRRKTTTFQKDKK